MSKSIDERVVQMSFDNAQFERNVQTSLTTIDKLKKSLDFSGASQGLENVNAAAKKVDMSALGSAVESVKVRFSALEVLAITALTRISNKAITVGKNVVSALTITPIKTGFQEYETQIGAIQTILANTQHEGTNLQQVNRALNELNLYADKTIYNFTEMTRNIGTFTAAGVKLQDSVDAIKGIANLAAVSGSTSQQASVAMYQLSQALAAGRVSLMDWNSVVNAGMGGKVFQDALIRTSELLGTGAKQAIATYGSFRESLTRGQWLTTEVLTETLKQFAGAYDEADLISQGFTAQQAKEIMQMAKTAEDAATKVKTFSQLFDTLKESAQSGWTTTWEILIGDFEEAKELLTTISDTVGGIIQKSADARNKLLSGGLSSGWKQLLDAGIADEGGYIEAIQEVARANGDAFDKMVADSDNFTDTLKKGLNEGVISSETLSDAVHNLRIKMEGMSQQERKAAGYTSDMVKQIQELDDGLRDGSVSMDEFTKKILRPSGRENIIEALWNAAKGLASVITPIKDAFRDIFPPMTAETLYNATVAIREFSEKLTLTEETSQNLRDTFAGVFSVLALIKDVFVAAAKAVFSLFDSTEDLGASIVGVTGSIGRFLVKLTDAIRQTDIFDKAFGGIATVIKTVAGILSDLINLLGKGIIGPIFETLIAVLTRADDRMNHISGTAGKMKDGITDAMKSIGESVTDNPFIKFLDAVWEGSKRLTGGLIQGLGNLFNSLADSINRTDFSGVLDFFNSLSLGGIALAVSKLFKSIPESLNKLTSVVDIFDDVRGCLKAYQDQLQAKTLMTIATAVGILAASLVALSLIDSKKLASSLAGMTALIGDLMGAMFIFSKIPALGAGVIKASMFMVTISASIFILAGALVKLSSLDLGSITKGVIGITALAGVLVGAAALMGKTGNTVIKGSTQMVIFATAINLLAVACKKLGQLKLSELAKGLVGLAGLLASVVLFSRTIGSDKNMLAASSGILVLSSAMIIMSKAFKSFGSMDISGIAKALVSIGGSLVIIAAAMKLMPDNMLGMGAGLIAVSAGLKIMSSAFSELGSLKISEVVSGLIALGGALLILSKALTSMSGTLSGSAAMVVAAGALTVLVPSIIELSKMNVKEVATGLISLAGGMTIMAVALKAMTGTAGGAASLLAAGAALAVIAPSIRLLGGMNVTSIAKGLITLAGAFTIMGVAGYALSPLTTTILALSASFAVISASITLLSVGLAAIGVGLAAAATGLTTLAAAGTAGATAIVASLTIITTGIIKLIPAIAEAFAEAVVAFCVTIGESADEIAKALLEMFVAVAENFADYAPKFSEALFDFMVKGFEVLNKYVPQLVDKLADFLISVFESLTTRIPEIVTVAVEFVAVMFASIIDALDDIDTSVLLKALGGIGILAAILTASAALSKLAPQAMVGILKLGLVIGELSLVLAALGALNQIPGLSWLMEEGGDLLQNLGTAIGKFIGGIFGGIMSGMSSELPQIATDLSGFMNNLTPFLDGAAKIDPSIMDGVKSLAETILILTGANILEGLTSWFTGGTSMTKFGQELAEFAPYFKSYYNDIQGIDASVVEASSNAAMTLAEFASKIPNTGGLVSLFTGENSMSAFAAELAVFGPQFKRYADSVAGMDPNVVINSANAAKSLAEMASAIPNTGGMVSWFTGDNSLATFGEELARFGPHFASYAQSIAGIDPNVVITSANAAKALSELANNLPEQGGFLSIFTADSDMSTFGKELKSFGNAMSDYYNSIRGIDFTGFGAATKEFGKLVDMAKKMGGVDTKGLTGFANGLKKLGETGVNAFIKAFTNASSKVKSAGSQMMDNFINGANSKKSSVSATFTAILSASIVALNAQKTKFKNAGSTIMSGLADGLKSKTSSITKNLNSTITKSVTEIRGFRSKFESAGKYLVQGFASGISANTYLATAKARAMARAAANAARNELAIHSPSRVGYEIGDLFGLGFVNAIGDKVQTSYDAGESMAVAARRGLNEAVKKINFALSSEIDTQPKITPVLDLSNLESKSRRISALLSYDMAKSANAAIKSNKLSRELSEGNKNFISGGNNYQFVQNNYSPKSLSRIDIYRQTKNQFSAWKGLVEQ